jgi:Arc/MetJ-type ribon-helix-helix transcriptional regulator
MRRNDLKIVTVNIPESYLESIKRLIGENGLYPSRSELIRVAVREFLIKELRRANEMIKYKEVEIEKLDDKNFVRVPIEKMDENNEPVREFKTYKIVKRLEY